MRKRTLERRRNSTDEQGVPECKSNFDCVVGGVCIKDRAGQGRCFCSSSCSYNIPVQCAEHNPYSCISTGNSYTSRFDTRNPFCFRKRCICPPQVDADLAIRPPSTDSVQRLPMKCDKRQLNAIMSAIPSESVYKGMRAQLFCCVNIDPRGFIPADGVFFVQNGTRRREPNDIPYEKFSSDIDTLFSVPTCWALNIDSAQLSDAGVYQCLVQPSNSRYRIVNISMDFYVKTPSMIENITITSNTTSATIGWDIHDEHALSIDIELFKRSDRRVRTDRRANVKSPITFENLSPGTPYTAFIHVTESQNEFFDITEHFVTADGLPDPPSLEDIRLVNSGGSGKTQFCEVEWKPPNFSRGRIERYYVQISGRLRHIVARDGGTPPTDHYPQGMNGCSNYEQDSDQSIEPKQSQDFFACKYGPLKPNRNYTATVWAENRAGRSRAASFSGQCVMDYAEPEHIVPPEILLRTNISSFGLLFQEPDQGNGPISCFYLAIVPLPADFKSLPPRELLAFGTFAEALRNNLNQSADGEKKPLFSAYIAESYTQLPEKTIVGDGATSGGAEPCNQLFMREHKANDPALTPDLKYTGFLIVRVDRASTGSRTQTTRHLGRRQLADPGPTYGYSDYFSPVVLNINEDGMSVLDLFLICIFVFLFLILSTSTVLYFLRKRGMIKQFWPIKNVSHDVLRPLIPPAPIRANDIPAEYILRHRDSDYQFTQEFEMLPRGKNLDHTISERKENARRNRYNDIKACDATRVRLRRMATSPDITSDYINANFIKGYKGRKLFIATQGPLESTVPDFWRMVWERGCRLVIMVTNLRERGREQCTKYWPDEDEPPLMFRTLEVVPLESFYYVDYTLRHFELSDSEPQPQTSFKQNGRTFSGTGSVASRHTASNSPPPFMDESQQRFVLPGPTKTQSPPPHAPVMSPSMLSVAAKASGNQMMSNSVYSAHSRSSPFEFDRHSSVSPSNVVRHRPDSEYANIASIIRPQSKCSERTSMGDGRERRRVMQYHFTSWNDYKAPECSTALLRLICKLRKMDEYNHWPVVIHCSAGVGRTGTFVAIDYVMDQMLDTGMADVFGCVTEMRQQRNLMVQSMEQYVFIYKALAEFKLFGDTDLSVPEYRRHVLKLRQPLEQNSKVQQTSTTTTTTTHFTNAANAITRSSTQHQQQQKPAATDAAVQFFNEEQRHRKNSVGGGQVCDGGLGASFRAKLRLMRNGGDENETGERTPNLFAHLNGGSQQQRPPRTILESEFQDLSIVLEKPKSTVFAHKAENASRNRFSKAVPFDYNRVTLQYMFGYENNYINASLIKGYFYPYIAAQDPLGPETAFDFWRMINDRQSYTIVMLSTELDVQPHEMYWPQEINKRLVLGKNDELTITLAEEVVQSGFVQRKLHYRFKQSDKGAVPDAGRDVLQYAFRQWRSASSTPNSAASLLDLIGRVLERQSNISGAGPIVLHCRDGSAENGVFCCVSLLLERLRSEQMIDVFRTVKALQLQRPLLFRKIEQYGFCYECVSEYLNSTSKK